MDKLQDMCYGFEHETSRYRSTTGKATIDRSGAFECRPWLSCCRKETESLDKFVGSLDASLSPWRDQTTGTQTDSGTSTGFDPAREKSFTTVSFERGDGGRLPQRNVDSTAGCRTNSSKLWPLLSSRPCLENIDWTGIKLPETGTASHSAKGKRNCPMEKQDWPRIKKRQTTWGAPGFPRRKRLSGHSKRAANLGLAWADTDSPA